MIDVGAVEDLAPGEPRLVEVDGTPVCLVNVDGAIRAVHDVCTHAFESLSGGWVEGDTIECPRHGATFSLETGEVLSPPATRPLPTFRVEVVDGRVLLDPTPSHDHPIVR